MLWFLIVDCILGTNFVLICFHRQVMVEVKMIAICQSGGEFVMDKDGTLSYRGGDAHAIDIDDQIKFNDLYFCRDYPYCSCTKSNQSTFFYLRVD